MISVSMGSGSSPAPPSLLTAAEFSFDVATAGRPQGAFYVRLPDGRVLGVSAVTPTTVGASQGFELSLIPVNENGEVQDESGVDLEAYLAELG